MATVTTPGIMDSLQRLLTAVQMEEVRRVVRQRSPNPELLLQELVNHGWLTSFQAQQLFKGRGPQLIVGSYALLEPLGKGATGQVYKARHLLMGRLVALKILLPDLIKDEDTVKRFYREMEATSRMSHPNVVHAYEAGPVGPALVLVMEYVDGVDLEQMVRKQGPLPASTASEYIRQASLGLHYAYEQGLVHRDIKPSNLLVAGGGRKSADLGTVKILDLGLARVQSGSSSTRNLTVLAGSGVMMGTPDYMAPEQALDLRSADIRSDIYSLGCTFFFLLAGEPPFGSATLAEKLIKHQQAEPPWEMIRVPLPAGLDAVLRKMLAKQPGQRYQTPAEVASALQPFCPVPVTAASPSSSSITKKQDRPRTGITPVGSHLPSPGSTSTRNVPVRRPFVVLWRQYRRMAGVVGLGIVLLGLVVGGLLLIGSAFQPPSADSQVGFTPYQRTTTPVAVATQPAVGDGLAAAYFSNVMLNGKQVTRIDPSINFDWGHGPPAPGIDRDNFSVRWTGQILPKYSETYTFVTRSDDGVRLWINNQLIIDNWTDHSATENSGTIALRAGVKADIKLEYYDRTGGALIKLEWYSTHQERQIVPQSQLFSNQPPGTAPAAKEEGNQGVIHLVVDNQFQLYINGNQIGSGDNWEKAYRFNVTLQPGLNLVAVKAVNTGGEAGLVFDLQAGSNRIVSSPQWKSSSREVPGWNIVKFNDDDWKPAADLGPFGVNPWGKKAQMPGDTPARWIWDQQKSANVVYFRHFFHLAK